MLETRRVDRRSRPRAAPGSAARCNARSPATLVTGGLSVRETEARARAALADSTGLRAAAKSSAGVAAPERADAERARLDAEDALSSALGLETTVRLKRRGCSVEILFTDLDDVHQFAQRIARRLAA